MKNLVVMLGVVALLSSGSLMAKGKKVEAQLKDGACVCMIEGKEEAAEKCGAVLKGDKCEIEKKVKGKKAAKKVEAAPAAEEKKVEAAAPAEEKKVEAAPATDAAAPATTTTEEKKEEKKE